MSGRTILSTHTHPSRQTPSHMSKLYTVTTITETNYEKGQKTAVREGKNMVGFIVKQNEKKVFRLELESREEGEEHSM